MDTKGNHCAIVEMLKMENLARTSRKPSIQKSQKLNGELGGAFRLSKVCLDQGAFIRVCLKIGWNLSQSVNNVTVRDVTEGIEVLQEIVKKGLKLNSYKHDKKQLVNKPTKARRLVRIKVLLN